ncbi:hypothetical protein [Gynuella sunshinyii]|uniref:Uncharacterized protein n=1 Tax=Gynuella sunshinyii YC6258 TaxID=1445510 RepID=A0A0C5VS75_9GAMM|nr:hypothetical protein [Gynuella sunshinyii]AJQ97517.1 hypothetical Protein YC6258_05489 [Gynuella sunshinyii YC6258]
MMGKYLLLWVVVLSIPACSVFSGRAGVNGYEVVSEPQANQDTATALDIVFIYRKELLAQLPDNAPQWFLNRAVIEGKFDTQMDVLSIEIPPGDLIPKTKLKGKQKNAKAVLLYANYLNAAAQQPINVSAFTIPQIILQPDKILVIETGTSLFRRLFKK